MMHSFLYRFLIIVLLAFVLPENANAAELCENIAKPSSGIAKGIVDCVKGQFKDQTNALIDALTEFMTDSSGSTGLSIWDGMVTLA
ncbi:MAG: hypothetical protein EBR02_05150, partial [Alphaproteobacteria bacterium]|nr:hypothetical protein [Alphaproteobacteria bacterium]